MQTVILAIGLLIFFSYAAAGIFARTRIPDILPLTLLGIVMGPVLGWIHPSDFGGVGVSMHLPKPGDWSAVLLVLAVCLSRALVTRFTIARPVDLREGAITSVMAPKGFAAAVLASVPLQAGIAGGEIIRDQTYFVVLISIPLTATMLPFIDRGMLKGCQQPSQAA